jgi:hypothetical protein
MKNHSGEWFVINREGKDLSEWVYWWKQESLASLEEADQLAEEDEMFQYDDPVLEMPDDEFAENLQKWKRVQDKISFLDQQGEEKVGDFVKYKNKVNSYFLHKVFHADCPNGG